jgi:hypothetical protein
MVKRLEICEKGEFPGVGEARRKRKLPHFADFAIKKQKQSIDWPLVPREFGDVNSRIGDLDDGGNRPFVKRRAVSAGQAERDDKAGNPEVDERGRISNDEIKRAKGLPGQGEVIRCWGEGFGKQGSEESRSFGREGEEALHWAGPSKSPADDRTVGKLCRDRA